MDKHYVFVLYDVRPGLLGKKRSMAGLNSAAQSVNIMASMGYRLTFVPDGSFGVVVMERDMDYSKLPKPEEQKAGS